MKKCVLEFAICFLVGMALVFLAARGRGKIKSDTNIELDTPSVATANDDPGGTRVEDSVTRGSWDDIESSDLAHLAANLRAVGCPEQTIRDLLKARIVAEYMARYEEIQDPLSKYWATADLLETQEKAINELRDHRNQQLAAFNLEEPKTSDKTVTKTSQLSPEKLMAIADITAQFPN
jgi:hypothetical protein